MADLRARKKGKKEEMRKKIDANNMKRKEMGIRSTIYNSSRVFTTPIPTFEVGDKVTMMDFWPMKLIFIGTRFTLMLPTPPSLQSNLVEGTRRRVTR